MQPRKLFWRLAALTVLVLPFVFATETSGQSRGAGAARPIQHQPDGCSNKAVLHDGRSKA